MDIGLLFTSNVLNYGFKTFYFIFFIYLFDITLDIMLQKAITLHWKSEMDTVPP